MGWKSNNQEKMLSDTSESERESGKEVENLPREICQAPIFIWAILK